MQIDFPSDDAPWIALDPSSWHFSLLQSRHPPSFRNALRELAGRGVVPENLSEVSLWILLHGLISVSWTLLWRDLGDLSMIHESSISHWKTSLKRAFAAWRMYIARNHASSGHPLDRHIYWAGIPFAHLGASLALLVNDADTRKQGVYCSSPILSRSGSSQERQVGLWFQFQAYPRYRRSSNIPWRMGRSQHLRKYLGSITRRGVQLLCSCRA